MQSEDVYFHTMNKRDLWQRYCGFLDLSIERFIEIQKELLMDEIDRVAGSILGKKIMRNRKPKSVEEFRNIVPLTSYDDYEPYLSEQQDSALSVKPLFWSHSSGSGGRFKWIPQGSENLDKAVRCYIACSILSSCNRKGEINIAPGFRFLTVVAPKPYTSGFLIPGFLERFNSRLIPPDEGGEHVDFGARIQKGFQMALKEGVDVIGAIASILVRMGEEVSKQSQNIKISRSMLHPRLLQRFLVAWIRSKRENRGILPKDLWQPKGIIVSGLDTAIYKDDVAYYWGRIPYELYTGTEGLVYAMQAWDKKGMFFLPDMVFLEFIPYEEMLKLQENESYKPSTVLLDEIEEGKLYEVVITNLYGMPLLRYRIKDVIKVAAIKNEEAGIDLPQIVFQRRADEVINLAGLCQLDEKSLWQAIANTGIKYSDWVACKEYDGSQSYLRIYLELKEEREAAEVEKMIDEQLKIVDTDYGDVDSYLGLQPIRVTFLSSGTFQRYTGEKIREGANLAQLKPARVNPPTTTIQRLIELSEVSG